MSVIRGKVFTDREIVPSEVTVGGVWPYTLGEAGQWVNSDGATTVQSRPLMDFIKTMAKSEREKKQNGSGKKD